MSSGQRSCGDESSGREEDGPEGEGEERGETEGVGSNGSRPAGGHQKSRGQRCVKDQHVRS